MKHRTQNRILSMLLCAVVAVTVLLLCVFAVTSEEFAVTHNGEIAENVTFSQDAKTEVALQGIPDDAELQWQIRIPNSETWVDISGQTAEKLTLSYALVASIMDQLGNTAVRCVARVNGEEIATAPVDVQMSFVADSSLSQESSYVQENYVSYADTYLADPTDDVVTVTVFYRYLEKDGTEVFDAWVAELAKGVSLQQTVSSPSTKGYVPAALAEEIEGVTLNDNGSVTFDLAAVTQDIVVTVIYQPVLVNYKVVYFTQNVSDDLYTQYATKTYEGYAGTTPDDPKNPENGMGNFEIPGFTRLYYVPETIAADGSTVFECYFDRNYYLINFELEGGYGTSPIYARYEDSVVVGNPVKPGYSFAGWDLVSIYEQDEQGQDILVTDHYVNGVLTEVPYDNPAADALPSHIGKCSHGDPLLGNYTFHAIWETSATTFTVVYWVQNANDDGYSYAHSISGVSATSADVINLSNLYNYGVGTDLPTDNALSNYSKLVDDFDPDGVVVSPYTSDYDTYGNETGVIVEGDGTTVFNIYFMRKTYTLRFVYARSYVDTDGETWYQVGSYGNGGNSKVSKDYIYSGDLETANWLSAINTKPSIDELDPAYYTVGEEEIGQYTYYYFDLTARYNQDLTKLWPVSEGNDENGVEVDTIVNRIDQDYGCIGWCATPDSGFGKNPNNSSHTISGRYEVLDDQILIDTSKTSEQGPNHILLGEWANGGWIKWEYRYYVGITEEEYVADSNGENFDASNYLTKAQADVILGDNSFTTYHSYWDYWRLEVRYQTYGWTGQGDYPPRTTFEGMKYSGRKGSTEGSLNIMNYFYYSLEHTLVLDNYGEQQIFGPYMQTSDKGDYHGQHNGDYQWNIYEGVDGDKGRWILYESGTAVDYKAVLSPYLPGNGSLDSMDEWIQANYPDTLEADAYAFDGWYTGINGTGYKVVISDEIDHDNDGKADLNYYDTEEKIWYNPLMPDSNLILFAHWVPKEWTISYYDRNPEIPGATQLKTVTTTHNTVMIDEDRYPNPTRDGYVFAGWFYINKQGEKTAFNIHSMKVQQDMQLFAEWSSKMPVTYTVKYELEGGTQIAEPTTGYSFAGYTKTVIPKIGQQLNGEYQEEGYFPQVSSHSILMKENEEENTFTFVYKAMQEVTYTVYYKDAETLKDLSDPVSKTVKTAIVTEKAKLGTELTLAETGKTYIPQAYTEQLILSSNPDENVITFYYAATDNSGGFVIYYYLQNLPGGEMDSYTQHTEYYYATADAGTEDAPTVINALDDAKYHKSFAGFELDETVTESKGEHEKTIQVGEVQELHLYYTRKSYSYKVQYMILYTTTELKAAATKTAVYGAEVSETGDDTLTYENIQYKLVSAQKTQSIVISDSEENNVITFYYEPLKTTLEIAITGLPSGCTDTFMFKLVGPTELAGNNSCIELIVAVQADGMGGGSVMIGEMQDNSVIVGLYAGEYQITALTPWNYEYSLQKAEIVENGSAKADAADAANPVIDLLAVTNNKVTFTYSFQDSDWLGDETSMDNEFAGVYHPGT